MKKICMILPSFAARGGITSVAQGYRGSDLEEKYQIRYIETYCDGGKGAKLWKAVSAYAAFLKELLFRKPDLIHIHSSFGASFYRKLPFIWLASWLHIPVVNHIHGADWDSFFGTAQRIKKNTYQKCDAMIALSEEWKAVLSSVVPADKIKVIHNFGIEPATKNKTEETQANVLFLGFLCRRKGCFLIPEVVSKVREKISGVKFILAGDGTEEDVREIKTQIEALGVSGNIQFPGWVSKEQKAELLSDANVFFLPSYAEGMPMSILEAMAYGLPVVSSNVGGIPQLVTHGENGLLCEPGDVQAFADAILSLLTDEQRRVKMGAESLDILKEKYTLEAHTAQIGLVYDELL